MLCASYCRPELMERGGGEGGCWIGLDPTGRIVEYEKDVIVFYPEFPYCYYPSNYTGLYSEFTSIGINGYLLFRT